MTATRTRFKPHRGQALILRDRKLYNTVNTGRQAGKSTLGKFLVLESLHNRRDVAFFGPTSSEIEDAWKHTLSAVTPMISHKNSQLKYLELDNGAKAHFISLDNPEKGRGKTLGRVIVDECRMIRNLKDAWEQTLNATLAKMEGDAYFLSTPNGVGTDWSEICGIIDEDWAHFSLKTEDNPFIPKKSIERAKRTLNPKVYAQEYEGAFVDLNSEPFFYNYNRDIHYSADSYDFFTKTPVWVSFDFNVSPCSCTIHQFVEGWGAITLREFQADGGTKNLCHVLESSDLMSVPIGLWRITGDHSGTHYNSSSGSINDYDIIQNHFGLTNSQFYGVEKVNKQHEYSRTLCNHFLYTCPYVIDVSCETLARELGIARPNKNGKLHKDRGVYAMDILDSWRYAIDAKFINGIDQIVSFSDRCKLG